MEVFEVRMPVNGRLLSWTIKKGDTVKANEPLFIYCEEEEETTPSIPMTFFSPKEAQINEVKLPSNSIVSKL